MSRSRLVPNAENASAADIDVAARASKSERSRTRLMSIKALILGVPRETVCKLFEVDDRSLRRWIVAFNGRGIDGLIESSHPGRPRVIKQEQALYYREIIEQPHKVGVTHWTAVKFHGHLREKLQVEAGYSTVVRFLHEQGYRLKVPQPWPDRQDEGLREAFRNKLAALLEEQETELWFSDEMGVEGDPRPRRRWAQKGSKPRVTKNGDHVRMNVCGMICPRTGQAFLLEFSHSDREVFQVFLDKANEELQFERKRQIFICDNASWHKSRCLRWGRFEPLYLPPYSPDMNPIERLWLIIKAEWFTDFVAKDTDALMERLDKALCWAIDRQELNRRTCAIRTEI